MIINGKNLSKVNQYTQQTAKKFANKMAGQKPFQQKAKLCIKKAQNQIEKGLERERFVITAPLNLILGLFGKKIDHNSLFSKGAQASFHTFAGTQILDCTLAPVANAVNGVPLIGRYVKAGLTSVNNNLVTHVADYMKSPIVLAIKAFGLSSAGANAVESKVIVPEAIEAGKALTHIGG